MSPPCRARVSAGSTTTATARSTSSSSTRTPWSRLRAGGARAACRRRRSTGTTTAASRTSAEDAGANFAVRGTGCVAADLDTDGDTDLYVTTATEQLLLWNDGDGHFTEGARDAGVAAFGWRSRRGRGRRERRRPARPRRGGLRGPREPRPRRSGWVSGDGARCPRPAVPERGTTDASARSAPKPGSRS